MKERFYTVDETADLLELHPRTIRRFIREGKLAARKIGRQWRIQETALMSLTGSDAASSPAHHSDTLRPDRTTSDTVLSESETESGNSRGSMTVSTVVDVPVADSDEAWRISSSVLAVMNGKGPEYGMVRYDYLFLEEEMKARFMFYGDPRFIGNMLILLSKITQ